MIVDECIDVYVEGVVEAFSVCSGVVVDLMCVELYALVVDEIFPVGCWVETDAVDGEWFVLMSNFVLSVGIFEFSVLVMVLMLIEESSGSMGEEDSAGVVPC